jgi:hypothetical protein
MADPAPTSAPLPTTADKTAGLAAGLVVVLSALGLPSKLGLTSDELARLLGDTLMLLCAIRAWWEGTQLPNGGSVVDPAGAAGGAVVSILGNLGVMSKLGLTADQTVGLVSAAFAQGAAARAWMRMKANKATNDPPPSSSTPPAPPIPPTKEVA